MGVVSACTSSCVVFLLFLFGTLVASRTLGVNLEGTSCLLLWAHLRACRRQVVLLINCKLYSVVK